MKKQIIHTENAPRAIGIYSQAVRAGDFLYISGQIPFVPETMVLVEGGIREQVIQVFKNLEAIAQAAGTDLAHAIKLTIYLTDLGDFPIINEVMAEYVPEPYPARVTIQVSALPKGAEVEIDAILLFDNG